MRHFLVYFILLVKWCTEVKNALSKQHHWDQRSRFRPSKVLFLCSSSTTATALRLGRRKRKNKPIHLSFIVSGNKTNAVRWSFKNDLFRVGRRFCHYWSVLMAPWAAPVVEGAPFRTRPAVFWNWFSCSSCQFVHQHLLYRQLWLFGTDELNKGRRAHGNPRCRRTSLCIHLWARLNVCR